MTNTQLRVVLLSRIFPIITEFGEGCRGTGVELSTPMTEDLWNHGVNCAESSALRKAPGQGHRASGTRRLPETLVFQALPPPTPNSVMIGQIPPTAAGPITLRPASEGEVISPNVPNGPQRSTLFPVTSQRWKHSETR